MSALAELIVGLFIFALVAVIFTQDSSIVKKKIKATIKRHKIRRRNRRLKRKVRNTIKHFERKLRL